MKTYNHGCRLRPRSGRGHIPPRWRSQRAPNNAEIEKLLEITKYMMPERDVNVLIPNAFLLAKWVKYVVEIKSM